MIRFLEDVELTIVTGFDEETDNITDEEVHVFHKGDEVDASIETDNDNPSYCDIEFSIGVAHGVQRSLIEVIQ